MVVLRNRSKAKVRLTPPPRSQRFPQGFHAPQYADIVLEPASTTQVPGGFLEAWKEANSDNHAVLAGVIAEQVAAPPQVVNDDIPPK